MIYNMVFRCLGRAIRCLCGHFWILAGWRSLEFWHLRAIIKLAWVQVNRHAYKRSVKDPGQKDRWNFTEWELPEGPLQFSCLVQPSLVGLEWHASLHTAENSDFFIFHRGDVQALPTLLSSLSIVWSVRTWPSHAPRSSSQFRYSVTLRINLQ
jgi:hypothetical protein